MYALHVMGKNVIIKLSATAPVYQLVLHEYLSIDASLLFMLLREELLALSH